MKSAYCVLDKYFAVFFTVVLVLVAPKRLCIAPANACISACAVHLRCGLAIHVCHLVAYNLRTYGFCVPVCHLPSRGLTLASCCVWSLQTDACSPRKHACAPLAALGVQEVVCVAPPVQCSYVVHLLYTYAI